MADEKDTTGATTGGTGSSPEANPAPEKPKGLVDQIASIIKPSQILNSAPQEPVILEEHVVEKPKPPSPIAAEVTAEDVGLSFPGKAQAQAPLPSIALEKPPVFLGNAAADAAPELPPVIPAPLKEPTVRMAEPAAPPAAAQQPTVPTAPLSAPQAPVMPPQPAVMPAALKPENGTINSDIEKILREVKLPERRDFKAAADPRTPPQPAPETAAPAAPAEAPAPSAEAKKNISSVHTLRDDLQHAVKDKKMSLVRAVSLEQDKKRSELIEEDFGRKERRKRLSGILFASLLLFFLGGAALFGVYLVMMSHSATETQQVTSLVFAEQSAALPLDNATPSELKRRIAAERQKQTGSLGSITSIIPIFQGSDPKAQPKQASAVEFLKAIGANAPDNLLRSIGPGFFFGLHVVDENAPVLVLPVTNYDRAFAGMLEWEHTMNADLSPMFTPLPTVILDANGIPSERVFTDDVMRNYDVRELKDDSGQVQLYYSFPSPNLLIIAESPYSFPELLSRLQSVRKL